MFYIFFHSYVPNTASSNRFLSFLRGFDELGVNATAVLLTSASGSRMQEKYNHIVLDYLWHDWPFARRIFNRLHSPIAMRRYLSRLKNGDIVLCYGSADFVSSFVNKKKIGMRVYHERSESPAVLPLPNPKLQSQYLKACTQLDGLFVISKALVSYYSIIGVDRDRIHIINMTVDYHRFIGLQKNLSVPKYIAYCGTASNNKDGVDQLIMAFSIVAQTYKDIKLYIVGETPSSEDKAGNLKLIKELGIEDRVVFTGMISAEQMPQLLVDATILALDRPDSLQAQNGFPTKLGEYLLSGNPVVVTKVGDIPLFLKDGETALLSEQRNPQEFASKICWALKNPDKAAVIGQNGKEVAMQQFNYLTETRKMVETIFGYNNEQAKG